MRVQQIKIKKWRHFENITLDVPDDAPVVCLVGGNGTGKSQMLELVASSAQHIGLSQGFESGRGNPYGGSGEFEVQFYIAPDTIPTLDDPNLTFPEHFVEARTAWDRTLTVQRSNEKGVVVKAGGIEDENLAIQLAGFLVGHIQSSSAVHYLMLDADRAYPKIQVPTHELGTAFETNWEGNLKSKSFLLTKNLYEEWFKYLLGTENRENNAHIQAIRIAREAGEEEPVFVDKMKGYRDSIKKVLPHLLFTGIESQKKQITFDSTGVPLTFDQLSGGEREISFLIGQIERFGLRKGLLLVDEPELHLNYDLLRTWIGFLKSTVEEGQIWLASHSLEVVEVTGQDATFLLERDPSTRQVVSCEPLASRPIVTTLSRAVGSPAFSISTLTFVLIEGEEEIGERERFRLMTAAPGDVRFMEAGNCREVLRRLDVLRSMSAASGEPMKLGGVVDGDWREAAERANLEGQGLHVLAVHEIENLLLHPPTVKQVIAAISGDPAEYETILRSAADRRAGSYIFDAARTQKTFDEFPAPDAAVRTLVHNLTWADFEDIASTAQRIADADPNLDTTQRALLKKHLEVRAKIYGRVRSEPDLWKKCEGKEVFRMIASQIGFSDAETAERAIVGAWEKEPSSIPSELADLRAYIGQL